MCCNNIDQEQGTIIHTGMLNAQGGYENDCSIVPLRDRLVCTFCYPEYLDKYTISDQIATEGTVCQ